MLKVQFACVWVCTLYTVEDVTNIVTELPKSVKTERKRGRGRELRGSKKVETRKSFRKKESEGENEWGVELRRRKTN